MIFQDFSENAVAKPKMALKPRINISVGPSCSGKRQTTIQLLEQKSCFVKSWKCLLRKVISNVEALQSLQVGQWRAKNLAKSSHYGPSGFNNPALQRRRKQNNYFGFPWLCLFLGPGLHRNHLSTPVTCMMSLFIIFFIQKTRTLMLFLFWFISLKETVTVFYFQDC